MHTHDITGGPGIGRLIQSLTRYTRISGRERGICVTFTIPVRCGIGCGGWIWDGSDDQVRVRITRLKRMRPRPGQDDTSEDWRFSGVVNSTIDDINGTEVRGVYSVATRTGMLNVRAEAQTAP